jgi:hypothetical protein
MPGIDRSSNRHGVWSPQRPRLQRNFKTDIPPGAMHDTIRTAMPYDVFISYAPQDRDHARLVWLDTERLEREVDWHRDKEMTP